MRALRLAVAAGAMCGCIPERDNPNDPSNRPRASLSVTVEGAGGSNQGTRATYFLLDASGSSDAKGRTLSFEWDIDGMEGADVIDAGSCDDVAPPCIATCPGGGTPCLRTRLDIRPEEIPGGVGTVERIVSVRVRAGGNSDQAAARALVTNRAPLLSVEESVFVPQRTGAPVLLDGCRGDPCATIDPDGDELTWRWEQLRPVTGTTSTLPAFSFPAPQEEQAMLFRVTVSDRGGLARSTGLVHVYVSSVIWLTTRNPSTAYRVFPDFRVVRDLFPIENLDNPNLVDTTGHELAHGSAAADEASMWLGVRRRHYLYDDPDNDPFPSGEEHGPSFIARHETGPTGDFVETHHWEVAPGAVPSIAISNGVGCAAIWAVGSDPHVFARLVPGDPAPRFFDTGDREPRFVHPGPAGSCWAVAGAIVDEFGFPLTPTSSVQLLGEDATPVFTPHLDVFDDVSASTVRDDGVLWVAGPDEACPQTTRLARFTADGAAPATACVSPALEVDGMAARATGGVYAHDRLSGLLYVLDSSGSAVLTAAPALALPDRDVAQGDLLPRGEPRLYEDAVEGHLWVVESQGRLLRFSDELTTFDLVQPGVFNLGFISGGTPEFAAVTFDPRHGHVLATVRTPSHSGVAWIPDHITRVAEVFVAGDAVRVSADPSRGGAWVADGTNGASAFRRIGAFGNTQVATAPPGEAVDVLALGDGGAIGIWTAGTESGGVLPIDAAGTAGTGWAAPGTHGLLAAAQDDTGTLCVLGVDPALDGVLFRGTTIAALQAAPSPAPPEWRIPREVDVEGGVCWATFEGESGGGYDGEVVRWDGSAMRSTPLIGPGALDVDPFTGDAWVVAQSSSGGRLVFRIPPDDPLTPELRFSGAVLLDVERSCEQPECLTLWVVRDQAVQRTDANGYIRESFFLGNPGDFYDFTVLP